MGLIESAYRRVVPLLLIGPLLSCAPQPAGQTNHRVSPRPEPETSKPQQAQTDDIEIRRERALWESAKVTSYRFVLRATCLCELSPRSPVLVEVRGGKPVSVKPLTESKYFYFYPESYKRHNTIDKLFDVIQEAVTRKAEVVSVSYDPALGYPTVIVIDEDTRYVDDEVTMWVEQFEIIQ